MAVISWRSLRSARSRAAPGGSATTEFCRYTAPSVRNRLQTVARRRVGSDGTLYTRTSHSAGGSGTGGGGVVLEAVLVSDGLVKSVPALLARDPGAYGRLGGRDRSVRPKPSSF